MPTTSMPSRRARIVAAPITLLIPGAGPPLARIARFLWCSANRPCASMGSIIVEQVLRERGAALFARASGGVVARGAHLRDRFRLDLPDAFAGDRQPPPDFFERHLAVASETVAQTQHFALAVVERSHRPFDFLRE